MRGQYFSLARSKDVPMRYCDLSGLLTTGNWYLWMTIPHELFLFFFLYKPQDTSFQQKVRVLIDITVLKNVSCVNCCEMMEIFFC